MGLFKTLAYVSTGMVAVTCAPLAGVAATCAAGVAASRQLKKREGAAYDNGVAEGTKAGEAVAKQQYETRMRAFAARLDAYHDAAEKLLALYAVGLAVANADGEISEEEYDSLQMFVSGCMGSYLPADVKAKIAQLHANPPAFQRAMHIARKAKLPPEDIEDVIMLVAEADGRIAPEEEKFIARWRKMAATMADTEAA